MATRSNIILSRSNGKYDRIYVHYDGYLSGVGETLLAHYTSYARVSELIDLGDLSCLGENISPSGDRHSYAEPEPGICIAYGRDRGETGTAARTFNSLAEACEDHEEYAYLFKDGKWYYTQDYPSEPFVDLAEALTREAEAA